MSKTGKVYRVYNADGSEWVDILRFTDIDVVTSTISPRPEQEERIRFFWQDGKTEASREYEDVTIPFPSDYDSQGRPEIVVKAIKTIRMQRYGQDDVWTFRNTPSFASANRESKGIRVYNNPNVGGTEDGIDWETYSASLNRSITSDYSIDVNVTNAFRQIRSGQEIAFSFRNDEITKLFNTGYDSNIWLDPFQVIVNVSFIPPEKKPIPKYILMEAGFSLGPDGYDTLTYTRYSEEGPLVEARHIPWDSASWSSYREGYVDMQQHKWPGATDFAMYPYAMFDKDGKAIGSGLWDELQAKLVIEAEVPTPMRFANSAGGQIAGMFDTMPNPFDPITQINGTIGLTVDQPTGGLINGLPGEMTPYNDWFKTTRPVFRGKSHILYSPEIDFWVDSGPLHGDYAYYKSGRVVYPPPYVEICTIEAGFRAMYDGRSANVIGYNADREKGNSGYHQDTMPMWITFLIEVPEIKDQENQ